jgi:hypothetical protein
MKLKGVVNVQDRLEIYSKVEVFWVDACVPPDRWESRIEGEFKEEDKLVPVACESIGYIYEDTDTYITLIGDKNKSEVGRKITIPKCSVAKINELQTKE